MDFNDVIDHATARSFVHQNTPALREILPTLAEFNAEYASAEAQLGKLNEDFRRQYYKASTQTTFKGNRLARATVYTALENAWFLGHACKAREDERKRMMRLVAMSDQDAIAAHNEAVGYHSA